MSKRHMRCPFTTVGRANYTAAIAQHISPAKIKACQEYNNTKQSDAITPVHVHVSNLVDCRSLS
jgi:hypothetical protein